jgi:hypothetical protein
MHSAPGNDSGKSKEHTGYLPADIQKGTVYAYNLDDTKTPGGIKVRYKIRVITGPEAARYDTRQADAILELLRWTHRHQHQLRQTQAP